MLLELKIYNDKFEEKVLPTLHHWSYVLDGGKEKLQFQKRIWKMEKCFQGFQISELGGLSQLVSQV